MDGQLATEKSTQRLQERSVIIGQLADEKKALQRQIDTFQSIVEGVESELQPA